MFRLIHLYQRFTAVTFLVIFLNVTVGQCLCAMAQPVPMKVPTQPAPTHAGCPGHALKASAKKSKQQSKPSPEKPGKHDCCKKKSAALLAGLSTPPVVKLQAPSPILLGPMPALDFSFPVFTAWSRESKVLLVPPQHLKPKIPDIRIFIQSLTV